MIEIIKNRDSNHLLLHIKQYFDNAVYPNGSKFRRVEKKVLKQLKSILYGEDLNGDKFKQIQQMREFILKKPFLKLGRSLTKHVWKWANDSETVSSLDNVISLCNDIASTFQRGHSTCYKESFHRSKI